MIMTHDVIPIDIRKNRSELLLKTGLWFTLSSAVLKEFFYVNTNLKF